MENWKDVVGYEGLYEVSDLGNVRGRRGDMKPSVSRKGYDRLQLTKDGVRRKHHVHCLVLEAFVGPRPNDFDGAHDNGDKRNNRLSNLAWKSSKENNADRKRHGTLPEEESHPMSVITREQAKLIKRKLAAGETAWSISIDLDISKHIVNNIKYGKTWRNV